MLNRLVDQGNSVLVIEHNLDVIKTADWVIDLGPEGGADGGRVVVAGTPEEVAACAESHTGQFLRQVLVPQSRRRNIDRGETARGSSIAHDGSVGRSRATAASLPRPSW